MLKQGRSADRYTFCAKLLDGFPGRRRNVAKDGGRHAKPGRHRKSGTLQANKVGGLSADGLGREMPGVLVADDSRVAHDGSGF